MTDDRADRLIAALERLADAADLSNAIRLNAMTDLHAATEPLELFTKLKRGTELAKYISEAIRKTAKGSKIIAELSEHLSLKEAAKELGWTEKTVAKYCQKYSLDPENLERISLLELRAFREQNKARPKLGRMNRAKKRARRQKGS